MAHRRTSGVARSCVTQRQALGLGLQPLGATAVVLLVTLDADEATTEAQTRNAGGAVEPQNGSSTDRRGR